MPGTQQATSQAHLFEVWRTPKPTIRVEAMETIPPGILRRAAFGLEKPKPAMRVAE